MELRVLNYFLTVVREENITSAAEALHITQPTLSRQLMDLEDELGTQLLIRGKRKITLTPDGLFFQKRAEQILNLAEKTAHDLSYSGDEVSGDITIGAAESKALRYITKAAKRMMDDYPLVRFRIHSRHGRSCVEQLEQGLMDFALMLKPIDTDHYEYMNIPCDEVWGIWTLKTNPLAEKNYIVPDDLKDIPLLHPNRSALKNDISGWSAGLNPDNLNIVGEYNLTYPVRLMVESGMGSALGISYQTEREDSPLCFRPFKPTIRNEMCVIWRKHAILSRASTIFLEYLRQELSDNNV